MHALTVATQDLGYVEALKESCATGGIALRVLGSGCKWGGFVWRHRLLESELAEMEATAAGDLAILLDGYDTIVCSSAGSIAEAHARLCKDQGFPLESTLVMGPEHHMDWCSVPFEMTLHRISKHIFGVPINDAYVINAGVIVGTVSTLLRYTRHIKRAAVDLHDSDDQRILNRLVRDGALANAGIHVAVDLTGAVAYCHANRTLARALLSQLFNHNRHRINHEVDLVMDSGGVRLRRNEEKVGVLHAISNADIDGVCSHLGIEKMPVRRKPISQPALRCLLVGTKMGIALGVIAFALYT